MTQVKLYKLVNAPIETSQYLNDKRVVYVVPVLGNNDDLQLEVTFEDDTKQVVDYETTSHWNPQRRQNEDATTHQPGQTILCGGLPAKVVTVNDDTTEIEYINHNGYFDIPTDTIDSIAYMWIEPMVTTRIANVYKVTEQCKYPYRIAYYVNGIIRLAECESMREAYRLINRYYRQESK
jgi:hypothetical protein